MTPAIFILGVEDLIAQDQRSHAARHAKRVDYEDDGRRRELRPARRSSSLPSRSTPSCSPLLPSISAKVGAFRARRNACGDFGMRLRVEVEVEARPAARARKPHRIDIVRPLFEGLHGEPARRKRRGKANGNGRLSRRLMRRR